MVLDEAYELNNGVAIPKLALGTWLNNGGEVVDTVRAAAGIGYRHIDTAQAYGNEHGVGEGTCTCGLSDYGASSFFPVFGGKL